MKAISILLIAIGCVMAQLAFADDALSNDGVIQLKQLGLGDAVIVEKIKTSHCVFNVGLDGLKQLKTAGISDDIIAAMLSAQSTASVSVTSSPVPAGDPNDPKSPHDAGIYLYEEIDGKPKMTEMEPTVYTQTKTGIAIFMAYGQTANSKAVLHPAHAMMQSTNSKPLFYFYFENTQAGLGETKNVATSPNEFVLAQFEVKDKDNIRSLIVGQMNAYTGMQNGPKDQSVRPIDAVKLAPGIYKVSPTADLANGEYCFFYGGNSTFGAYGTMGNNKVFDFGIKSAVDAVPPAVEETTPTTSPKMHQGR